MPLIGSEEFKIASTTVVVSFIVSFGVIKAFANLVSGHFADVYGRKHMLVLGWLIGLPVPFMIGWAPSWGWVVAANALLGINQGFAWSMTVIMKVDLVGPKSRGLAVGLNEFAGYLAVGVTAFLAGYIAQHYGLRPQPFYLGIGYALLGLILSILLVRDTRHHVGQEITHHHGSVGEELGFWEVFRRASLQEPQSVRDIAGRPGQQSELRHELGDFPAIVRELWSRRRPDRHPQLGLSGVWGVLQTVTGPLSDRWGRKGLIVAGMWVQAAASFLIGVTQSFGWWLLASVLLGLGTAMVYPTLIAAVSDASHPSWRARSLSVYRFWRDLGYAVGALSAGIIADTLGMAWAIRIVAALSFVSGAIVALLMRETKR